MYYDYGKWEQEKSFIDLSFQRRPLNAILNNNDSLQGERWLHAVCSSGPATRTFARTAQIADDQSASDSYFVANDHRFEKILAGELQLVSHGEGHRNNGGTGMPLCPAVPVIEVIVSGGVGIKKNRPAWIQAEIGSPDRAFPAVALIDAGLNLGW